jgi:hypothetical protein
MMPTVILERATVLVLVIIPALPMAASHLMVSMAMVSQVMANMGMVGITEAMVGMLATVMVTARRRVGKGP